MPQPPRHLLPRNYSNPWGLTPAEVTAMDAVIKHRSQKGAAGALGVSPRTIDARIDAAKRKFGSTDRISHFIEWDRWRQASKVPA